MEPTQAYAPGFSEAAAPKHAVELVSGSVPPMSTEFDQLLRNRLAAVALCLAIGTAVFLVAGILTESSAGEKLCQTVSFLGFCASISILYSRIHLSRSQLRSIELAVFGVAALALAGLVVFRLRAQSGDEAGLMMAVMLNLAVWCLMMPMYTMMIPSTVRRSAIIIGMLSVTPVALILVERAQDNVVRDVVKPERLGMMVTLVAIAAGLSLYAAHSIGALRKQAFEARRFGQYQLKELLGAGGMGEVRLAEHLLLKRPCAIKVIRPDRATDASALARFEREVRAAAELTHPNTIAIYDYGRADDGSFYYVMEYLPGLTLAEMVERHGPLPPDRIIHLLRQVCGALGEAHARGLVHRDIKPGNIIVTERGGAVDFAKLLDFGLVKPAIDNVAANQLTQENMIAGSPLYMSPEQSVASHDLDGRSDIYSLGAVAYFLMTGQPPFAGLTTMEVIVAHARDAVTPPSRLNAAVPHDLEKTVLRCLEKDRNDRFQNAEDFDGALAACESAGRWTKDQAGAWWRERTPDRTPRKVPASV